MTASKDVSFGEKSLDTGADIIYRHCWYLMRYILKTPLFVDYLTSIIGLKKKLASTHPTASPSVEEIVPLRARPLFVLDFENMMSSNIVSAQAAEKGKLCFVGMCIAQAVANF
jgi:hypothetical protein